MIAVLLLVWLAFSILGASFDGLLWLTTVGVLLFVATVVYGIMTRRGGRRTR
jgi:hypothetical protein